MKKFFFFTTYCLLATKIFAHFESVNYYKVEGQVNTIDQQAYSDIHTFNDNYGFLNIEECQIPIDGFQYNEEGFKILDYEAGRALNLWPCPKCNYWNNDYCDTCQNCGFSR
jgi:hypothetical protein